MVTGSEWNLKTSFLFLNTVSHLFLFRNGLKHGEGVRVYSNGNQYTGSFASNEPNGGHAT